MKTEIQTILKNLPSNPGIYQFYDKNGNIIYIGKAKNLKKRVKSYFQKVTYENKKVIVLIKQIYDIKYIIVETESDALLLENSLIKKHQPKYNVQLKDDKTFPWICIKNEPFPRVYHTRKYIKDGSFYFGPYTSMQTVRTILNLIKQIFKLRTCNYSLTNKNIADGKFKVCLEYHIGNCKAPCVGKQSENEYNANIEQIKSILKGNISGLLSYLKSLMKEYSANLKFEDAQVIKERIDILEKYKSKSTVINPTIKKLDVFSFLENNNKAYVNYLKIIDGTILQSHTIELKKKLDESKEELLIYAIIDIRQKLYSDSGEAVVPFKLSEKFCNIKFIVPLQGDKKQLLNLSERNLKYFVLEQEKIINNLKDKTPQNRILETLKNDLHLPEIPYYIECFDNSNIQGTNPVAACVVFKNARPLKKEYRHYNIKTVQGPNDFASMEEVVERRYTRLLNEKQNMPQLIVIDGGKGQLSSAYKSIKKLGLDGRMSLIGIAKKLEEIYVPNDPVPIFLDKSSESLKLIQNVRNEAHRFGITFHRQKRSKGFVVSELEKIKGVGNQTIETLFGKFKSIENIKSAGFEELEQIIGKTKAKLIKEYYSKS